MKRLLSEPRPDWKQKIEEQGLVFSTTTLPGGKTIEYWNEAAYYEFTMDEVEALEVTAEDMHRMCIEAAKFLATDQLVWFGEVAQAPEGIAALAPLAIVASHGLTSVRCRSR